ncbi:hypothetical protein SAMN05421788_102347 [Filimonas lacunae]|uniref:Uncharacterized protein n=2 Tax=Filimonas lacunae TaxID=477680 RepID=A0A173MHC9_9BACT|nr:hypothetical protein [Filimonas lacunae]BAV07022.1 hypothetical protein FLA_3042 [Filimonas lacunae]SIS96196.1 hypothetical protein SAMN05421788_102347 [Filimonas lacunae]
MAAGRKKSAAKVTVQVATKVKATLPANCLIGFESTARVLKYFVDNAKMCADFQWMND